MFISGNNKKIYKYSIFIKTMKRDLLHESKMLGLATLIIGSLTIVPACTGKMVKAYQDYKREIRMSMQMKSDSVIGNREYALKNGTGYVSHPTIIEGN